MQLHVLEHGYLEAVDSPFLTEDGKQELVTTTWPDRCYLIDHPRGRLLWDTGLPEAKLLADPFAVGELKKVITAPLLPWLDTFGVSRDDIDYLGFSHLHVDHAGNANLFASATVLLNAHEHAFAFAPDVAAGYYPEDYSALRDSSTILIEDQHDVFGDSSVVIHAAPGHTVGHQILILSLPDHRPLILAGDMYYDEADRIHRRAPAWNADLAATFHSMDRIERLATEINAQLLIHHAPNAPSVWP